MKTLISKLGTAMSIGIVCLAFQAKALVWDCEYDSGCLWGPCNCAWAKINGVNATYGHHLVHDGDVITAKYNGNGCNDANTYMGSLTVSDGINNYNYNIILPAGYNVGRWLVFFNATTGVTSVMFDASNSEHCP